MTDELHPAAAGLLGIPFERGGRRFEPFAGGADCLGLALEFQRRRGVDAGDPWDALAARWRDGVSDAAEHTGGAWKPVSGDAARRVGDVAVCERGGHVVPYVGGGYCLHARRNCTSHLGRVSDLSPDAKWYRHTNDS